MNQLMPLQPRALPKIITIFAFAILIVIAWGSIARAAPLVGPIISCGRSGQPACNLCDIGVATMNLTNFLIYYVALPATALLIAAGGIMLLISGPSKTMRTKGKTILTATVIGIIIVLTAWILVDTIIKVLTNNFNFSGNPGTLNKQFGPWNKFDASSCPL